MGERRGGFVRAGFRRAGTGGSSSGGNIADQTLLGNNTGAPHAAIALTPAQVRTLLSLAAIATSGSASDIGSGTLAAARIADASLALAKLANIPDQTILGNNIGVAGPPITLTAAQLKTILGITTIVTSLNGAAGAATLAAADTGVQIGGVAPALTVGQVVEARWPLTAASRRVYLVDGVNGNDANAGFLDGGAAVFPISGATIAATALKTIEALAAIFPRVGNGRAAEIIIAAGTYTGSLSALLSGVTGYQNNYPIVRGTATSATANCTAFDGSTADNTFLGAVTVTGMNAAGYNPTGVPTNQVIPCLKVGGADPAFPAEPAAPLGWRIRFDAATATAALRNICREAAVIAEGGGVGTITTATTLPAVPAAADVFYLEQAGVVLPGGNLTGCSGMSYAGIGGFRAPQLVGILCSSAFGGIGSSLFFCFCGLPTGNSFDGGSYACDATYLSADRGTITAGGGLVVTGTLFSQAATLSLKKIIVTTLATIQNPLFCNFKEFVCGTGLQVTGTIGTDNITVTCIGSENQAGSGQLTSRILGSTAGVGAGLGLVNCKVVIGQIDFVNMGARPGVLLNEAWVFQHPATGGTALTSSVPGGNTNFGLSMNSASTYIKNFAAPHNTVTGTSGDLRVSGTALAVPWAATELTGFVDVNDNRMVGVIGPLGVVGKFSGAIVTSAVGATTSYLADSGSALAVANLSVPQRYPTSLRLITRLRVAVSAVSGALSNSVTATVYQGTGGGVPAATAMQVNIPSGSAVGTLFVDSAHPLLALDGDTFDVRLDDAGADAAAGTLAVSAVLEGPV
jgi:hypothetical protein